MLTDDRVISIGTWTNDAATNPLNQVFSRVLPKGAGLFSLKVSYVYDLVPGIGPDDAMSPSLPVALLAPAEYGASTIADIVTVVSNWQRDFQPAPPGGRLVFDLTVYSPSEQGHRLPQLRLSHLVSPLA